MDTVEVRWIDAEACEDDRWCPLDEAKKYSVDTLKESRSVGYLLANEPSHIAIATSDGVDQIGTIWKIPRGCIVTVSRLIDGGPYV